MMIGTSASSKLRGKEGPDREAIGPDSLHYPAAWPEEKALRGAVVSNSPPPPEVLYQTSPRKAWEEGAKLIP